MRKTLLILALTLAIPAYAADTAKLPKGVAAVVNGANITQAAVDNNVKLNVERGQKDTPEFRKIILDELIARELFSQEAVKRGLDKTLRAQEQFALLKQNYLIDLYVNDYVMKNEIKEDDMRAEYDRQVAALGDTSMLQEYSMRNIIVAKETDAKAVIVALRQGESFERLAKEKSIDGSKDNGGYVGWVLLNQMPSELGVVVGNLQRGGYTQVPLKTNLGWLIVKVDDTRPYSVPTYEASRVQLKNAIIQARKGEALKKLRETAKVTQ